MEQLFRSKAATVMGGAITAVAATTTVGTAATTMAGNRLGQCAVPVSSNGADWRHQVEVVGLAIPACSRIIKFEKTESYGEFG